MDVEKVFRMKGGLDETSYSKNSSLQKMAADKVKHITLETIVEMFFTTSPKSLGIADLGCSSGPNTLSNVKELVDAVEKASRAMILPAPEFRVYLNDLPTNDFNTIFQALPDLYKDLREGRNNGGPPVYIMGCPGTFYGRLFPDHSLHFVYSSTSLHWLSKVPPGIYDKNGKSINKKSIYILESSPPQVIEAYYKQFQDDFSLFLQSRADEVVTGGGMVLILSGRTGPSHLDRGNTILWKLLYQSLASLVTQGEIEEEKLESYEINFYAPSQEELEEEVRKEGSFKVERIELFEMGKGAGNDSSHGVAVAKAVRSIQETLLSHHFGDKILDKLFHEYGKLVDQELAKEDINSLIIVLALTKL